MNRISRDEAKVFIGFLVVFMLFLHWGSVNSYSRYDLTTAMVEDGSIEITPYSYNTVDKRKIGGTRWYDLVNRSRLLDPATNMSVQQDLVQQAYVDMYNASDGTIYSDKAPFSSVLAIPGYLVGRTVGDAVGSGEDVWVDQPNRSRSRAAHRSTRTALEQFFITLTVPALMGALLLVLVYRRTRELLDERVARYTVLIGGLATPLFYYATSFYGVMAATTLLFGSYYMLERYLADRGTWRLAASGVLAGLAIATELYVGLGAAILLAYLVRGTDLRTAAWFVPAVVVGTLPLLVYNFIGTGNPFDVLYFTSEHCNFYPVCYTYSTAADLAYAVGTLRPLNVAGRLLFSPVNGILFLSPVLVLALPGVRRMVRTDRHLLPVAPGVFVAFFVFNSAWIFWMAGWTFGPRYLVPGLPFLLITVAYGVRHVMDGARWMRLLALVLFLLSTVHMLAAFQPLPYESMDPGTYEDRFLSLQPVWPDFHQDRMETFLAEGPRSELLQSMFDRAKGFDVTYRPPPGPRVVAASVGGRIVTVDTAFLPVLLMAGILGVVWLRDRRHLAVLGLGIVLVLAGSVGTADHRFGDGFHPSYREPGEPWMGTNGTLHLAAADTSNIPALTIHPDPSVNNTGSVTVTVNGEDAGTFTITRTRTIYLTDVPLREGTNTVTLRSDWGCATWPGPGEPFPVSDDRCISYQVTGVDLVAPADRPYTFRDGFHRYMDLDRPWMGREGTLGLSLTNASHIPAITVRPDPNVNNNGTLTLTVNGERLGRFHVTEPRNIHLIDAPLEQGPNTVTLRSDWGCRRPPNRTAAFPLDSDRCISYRITNVTVSPPPGTPGYTFAAGFSPTYHGPGQRWMGRNGTITVDRAAEQRIVRLDLRWDERMEQGAVNVSVNGDLFWRPYMRTDRTLYIPVPAGGPHTIDLAAGAGCTTDLGPSVDRCASYRVGPATVMDPGDLPETVFYWDLRAPSPAGYRWIAYHGRMLVRNDDGQDSLSFTVRPYHGLVPTTAQVRVRNQGKTTTIRNIPLDAYRWREVTVDGLGPGLNWVSLVSHDGCLVPAEHDPGSRDTRCLSLSIANVTRS